MFDFRILGAIVIVAGAVFLLHVLTREDGPAPTPESTETAAGSPGTGSGAPDSAAGAPPAEEAQPQLPTFETIRVDPDGNAVIAGRAAPDVRIELRTEGRVLGGTTADGNGQWVVVPDAPLAPGKHVITPYGIDDSGTASAGDESMIVVVPEPGRDVAGNEVPADAAAGGRTPLVVIAPRDDAVTAPTRVAQIPRPPPADSAAGTVVRVFPAAKGGPGGDSLPLDTIDYDESGNAVLSGRAGPGKTVQVFIDGALAGTATADDEGKWVLRLKLPDNVEEHRIRIRQLDESGVVTADIELPFLKARPFTDLPDALVVVVQPGNSLWRISRRIFGRGIRYTEIFQANADQIRDPDLVFPGQVLGLPRTE